MATTRKTIIFLVMLFAVLIFSASFFQKEIKSTIRTVDKEEKGTQDWKKLIYSEDSNDRQLAKKMVLDQYKDTIEYLITVADSPIKEGEYHDNYGTSRNIAIYLLGKLKAKEAISCLVSWLAPREGQKINLYSSWYDVYHSPAMYAMIDIGLPSVPVFANFLKEQDNAPIIIDNISIIAAIKGIPETKLLIDEMLKKEEEPKKKENLQKAQDLMNDPKELGWIENIVRSLQEKAR